jgi:putative transposase
MRRSELVDKVKSGHRDRDMSNYGSPRMHQELVSHRHDVSENTVAKLMRDHGIRAARSRKFRVTTLAASRGERPESRVRAGVG